MLAAISMSEPGTQTMVRSSMVNDAEPDKNNRTSKSEWVCLLISTGSLAVNISEKGYWECNLFKRELYSS